jgi:hypothetical protein
VDLKPVDHVLQVKGYTADIEALEEEIERWKQAATDEAAAGAAVMEDLERCQYEVRFSWVNCFTRRFMTWVILLQNYWPLSFSKNSYSFFVSMDHGVSFTSTKVHVD